MTSEIAAAAERDLRESIDEIRELSGDVADVLSGGNPHDTLTYRGTLLHRLLEAACVLQRHVLAEHPSDDAELVTEEWLRSSGFYPAESYGGDGGTWNKNIGGSDDDTICFNLTTMKSELWVGSRYISIPGSTRGDVRRLLAALKITLTEKDAHV